VDVGGPQGVLLQSVSDERGVEEVLAAVFFCGGSADPSVRTVCIQGEENQSTKD